MSNQIALLALEASDATVVLTSITLVFGMLVALCLIITLEGKIFDAANARKNGKPKAPKVEAKPAAPAPKSAAPVKAAAPAPAAPAVEGGIPGDIIAAIAAAVASLDEGLTIRGIRRAQKPKAGSRRGVWGDAGVVQNTTPFM